MGADKEKGKHPMSAQSAKPITSAKLIASILPRTVVTILFAALALPVLGASTAHAEAGPQTGKVYLTHDTVVRYRNVDFDSGPDRQALLAKVEKEARKFCDGYMVKVDRRDCENRLVINAMKTAPDGLQRAIALALVERKGVAQAMR